MAAPDALVTINDVSLPSPGPSTRFGHILHLTQDSSLLAPTGAGQSSLYGDLAALARDYLTTSDPYGAGLYYFRQSASVPPLVVGRWNHAAAGSRVIGARAAYDLTAFTGLGNSVDLTLGGQAVTGIDLASAASFAAVATALQTAFRAVSAFGATFAVEWDRDHLVFTYATTRLSPAAFAVSAAATTLGLNAGSVSQPGSAAQTIGASLAAIATQRGFDGLVLDETLVDSASVIDAYTWCKANNRVPFFTTRDADFLVSGTRAASFTASYATDAPDAVVVWSEPEERGGTAAAAQMASPDLDSQRLRGLNGVVFTGLTPSLWANETEVINAMRAYNINYVRVEIGDDYMRPGVTAGGEPVQTVWFASWYRSRQGNAMRRVFTAADGHLPYDLETKAVVEAEMNGVSDLGVANRGLAAGTVTTQEAQAIMALTGVNLEDLEMPTPYINFAPDPTTLSDAVRASGKYTAYAVRRSSGNVRQIVIDNLVV